MGNETVVSRRLESDVRVCRSLGSAVGLALVMPLVYWIWQRPQAALSLLGGIALWGIPNVYFAYKLLCCLPGARSGQVVRTLYRAEGIKLILGGALFLIVIRYLPIIIPALLLGYGLVQLLFWVIVIYTVWQGARYEYR